MWFEARRQEKRLRNIMVDHKKRAERRRQFYERIKKDPAEFMQIHGRQYKIYLEPTVAQAAESPAILRPWQGDSNILIDRFDARSHLDFIPEIKNKKLNEEIDDDVEWDERHASYERYRILVLNDFEKVTEEKFLKQIYMEENFGQPVNTLAKSEEEKKRKLADQKAAIAFKYEDSEDTSSVNNSKSKFMDNNNAAFESDESSESEESEPDIDKRLDVNELSNEECKELNSIAMKYQMQMGDFVKCLWEDHDELEQLQTIRDIEGEKAAMAGKHSRRERKILKEMKIRERGLIENPLGVLRVEEPKKKRPTSRSSSSSSESSDAPVERIQYITSFGGAESDGEGTGYIQGPAPPPTDTKKRLQELRNRRSSSSDKLFKKESSKPKSYSRHNRTPSRSRSRSKNRSSRHRRSRSSSRRRYHTKHNSSSRRSTSRSRFRSRSRSRSRSRRRRSSSKTDRRRSAKARSKSRSRERYRTDEKNRKNANGKTTSNIKKSMSIEKQPLTTPFSVADSPVLRSKSPSPKISDDNDSDLSMLSLHSDMSDSEQERRQVENTRRRLKKTKKSLMNARRSQSSNESSNLIASTKAKGVSSIVDKLKLQTQKALKRTLAQDKEEERQRQEEMQREQMEREEELREMAILLRKKEREKYLAEQAERQSELEKSSSNRESRKRRSRSRSKSSSDDRHRKRSRRHRSRSKSRSSSRSKSKSSKKLVDY